MTIRPTILRTGRDSSLDDICRSRVTLSRVLANFECLGRVERINGPVPDDVGVPYAVVERDHEDVRGGVADTLETGREQADRVAVNTLAG